MQLGLFNDVSRIPEIKQEIARLYQELHDIQENCPHPMESVVRVAKSDTGNWCRDDDRYWYQCECKLCEKRWMEDQ